MGMKLAREIQYPRKEGYEYTNKSEVRFVLQCEWTTKDEGCSTL